MRVLVCVATLLTAAGCSTDTYKADVERTEYGSTCGRIGSGVQDAQAGMLTGAEFRDDVKDVIELSEVAGPATLKPALEWLLAAVTQNDAAAITATLQNVTSVCNEWYASLPPDASDA